MAAAPAEIADEPAEADADTAAADAAEAAADDRRDEGGLSVAITAADVKKLRELTGAGMMDCKKALEEAEGDFDKATELLRIKLGKKAAARGAEREATSGLVATSGGALVELKSETDFVAKNDDFVAAAQKIADAAAEAKAADTEALKAVPLDGKTVGEVVEELAITIGEKIELGQVAYFDGQSVVYMHKRAADLPAGRRRARRVRRLRRGGRPRRRHADRRDEAAVPLPRRGPCRRRGEGARDRRGHRARGGQARAGDREDRRGSPQRLLQGRRPARPAVGHRHQEVVKAVLDAAGVEREAVRPLRGRRLIHFPSTSGEAGTTSSYRPPVAWRPFASAHRTTRFAHGPAIGSPGAPARAERGRRHDRLQARPAQAVRRGVRRRQGRRRPRRGPQASPARSPSVQRTGVQVAIVTGGGNFFRGAELQQHGMDRARADYMGMLGIVMNCLALQDFLEKEGIETRVQTAITMGQVAEPYIPRRAIRHLEKGRVVIFGAGAGMPYFSTDTVAAQRALETKCEVVLMGKNGVDGVYNADPRTHPDADEVRRRSPSSRPSSRASRSPTRPRSRCAWRTRLPMIVFGMQPEGNILRVVQGEKIGTLVSTGVPAGATEGNPRVGEKR